jgi:SAM-dependent methyltransferase
LPESDNLAQAETIWLKRLAQVQKQGGALSWQRGAVGGRKWRVVGFTPKEEVMATSRPQTAGEAEIHPSSALPLMQLATSFWAFKALAVANDLDLFSKVSARNGLTAQELAEELKIALRPADMLLAACASLGLLSKKDGRYVNSEVAEQFLVAGRRYYFGGWINMLDKRLYHGWDKLGQAIRANAPTTWDPATQNSLFEGLDPVMLSTFWEAMHSLSTLTARALGQAVDLRSYRRLLDVGGGSGAFDLELCRAYPQLEATVYDLAPVARIAQAKAAEADLSNRVSTIAGNFFTDREFPRGYDLILFSMILHDWDERQDRDLLRKCYEALEPGGAVLISELLMNDDKTGPPAAALMDINMLIETEGGRNYTAAEYGEWLRETGFTDIKVIEFAAPGATGVVMGTKG